jgi:hypothetical protein
MIQILQCPITARKSYKIPELNLFNNVALPAAGSIISVNIINISELKNPTLYIEWQAPAACTNLAVKMLVLRPKPAAAALLLDTVVINTESGLGAVDPSTLANGYYWPLIDPAAGVYLPAIKIQLENGDPANALNAVKAYIIGGQK